MSVVAAFLLLSSVSFCGYITICYPFTFGGLLGCFEFAVFGSYGEAAVTYLCRSSYRRIFLREDEYSSTRLNHMAGICLTLRHYETFLKGVVPFYIPTRSL